MSELHFHPCKSTHKETTMSGRPPYEVYLRAHARTPRNDSAPSSRCARVITGIYGDEETICQLRAGHAGGHDSALIKNGWRDAEARQ